MSMMMSDERMTTGGLFTNLEEGWTQGQVYAHQWASSSSHPPDILQWIHLFCSQTTRQMKSGGSWYNFVCAETHFLLLAGSLLEPAGGTRTPFRW